MTDQTSMVRIEEAWLRTADISHMAWDRGHSFTHLRITMSDGTIYIVKDWNGSAYAAEQAILAGVAADEARESGRCEP